MQKRALIVGSQILGLAGVDNDVEAIAQRLDDRGFSLDIRRGADASGSGFRDGVHKLIRDTTSNDLALVYYSGHGARVCNPDYAPGTPGSQRLLQCLVTTDWSSTTFCGILSLELSLLLTKLTNATRNVSVVIDSCYSARMWKGLVRSEAAKARVHDGSEVPGVDKALAELRRAGLASLFPESNPHAIRLVAAEADRPAYEQAVELGGRIRTMGIMTATLCEVLDELGSAPVTWRTLALLVRERVMFRYDLQRPELEGPGNRIAFEAGTAGVEGAVAYFDDAGEPSLRTSRMLGADVGARYAILAAGEHELRPEQTVAEATVVHFEGTCARVRLEPPTAKPANGALAYLLESPLGKRGVRLHGSADVLGPLREVITSSRFVTEVQDGPLIEVVGSNEGLVLRSVSGEALSHVTQNRGQILRALENWAKADNIRLLAKGGLVEPYRLTWGRVVKGQQFRMASGNLVHVGDGIYVQFENLSELPLYFSAIDIGVDGTVTLLTRASPTGTKVAPKSSYTLGLEQTDTGMPLSWPDSVPPPEAVPSLPESIVVIVAAGLHDFAALETGKLNNGVPNSSLGQLLGQIGSGGVRSSRGRKVEIGDYSVERIDFMVSPLRRS